MQNSLNAKKVLSLNQISFFHNEKKGKIENKGSKEHISKMRVHFTLCFHFASILHSTLCSLSCPLLHHSSNFSIKQSFDKIPALNYKLLAWQECSVIKRLKLAENLTRILINSPEASSNKSSIYNPFEASGAQHVCNGILHWNRLKQRIRLVRAAE